MVKKGVLVILLENKTNRRVGFPCSPLQIGMVTGRGCGGECNLHPWPWFHYLIPVPGGYGESNPLPCFCWAYPRFNNKWSKLV